MSIAIRHLVLSTVFVFGFTDLVSAANERSIRDVDKRFIVRLSNEENMKGTGVILRDTTGDFYLVTNRHVVSSADQKRVFDSVRCHVNIVDSLGEVRSLDSTETIFLRFKGRYFYREHYNQNVDLVVIRLGWIAVDGDTVLSPPGISHMLGYQLDQLVDKIEVKSDALLDGLHVQLVGFSTGLFQSIQYHTSRFGLVSFYSRSPISMLLSLANTPPVVSTLDWIVLDISGRQGDSGGPVFINNSADNHLYLLGVLQSVSDQNELSFVIPAYYVLDIIKAF